MKFSILIPTRNRLIYLRYAIETILRQDYEDWEVIISDNHSEEDIAGYVESLKEPRIRYTRTESFIPVTDNWNNAMRHSRGDYLLMIGDDDALCQGYLRTVARLLDQYDSPEALYTGAYLYAYPNAMPDEPRGYLRLFSFATFFEGLTQEKWLEHAEALALVHKTMQFKAHVGYNMQYVVISRACLDRIQVKGAFYQSPYPDFYGMNVLMLEAKRILITPLPLMFIGITSKSFGSYVYNRQEKEASSFLQDLPEADVAEELRDVVLPGGSLNTGWLYTAETLRRNYGQQYNLRPDYARYRFLQTLDVFSRYLCDHDFSELHYRELLARLHWAERLRYGWGLWLVFRTAALLPVSLRRRVQGRLKSSTGQTLIYDQKQHPHYFQNIMEVFEEVQPVSQEASVQKSLGARS